MSAADFDRIDLGTLRRAGSLKWAAYPDAIGAFVAEMDFGIAPVVTAALHAAVTAGGFGYLPDATTEALSAAYAAWSVDRYGWALDPADVRPIPDVLFGLTAAIQHFSAPGRPVILPTPAYMPFLTVPVDLGREVIQLPSGPGGRHDLDALDAAFAAGADLLILCNPHNPLGRVLTPEEMYGIAAVVQRHGARVFSDEVHAPLVFAGHRHVPYASLSPVTAGHTLTATSASKAWNMPGLKCAQVILSNDADRETWARLSVLSPHRAATPGVVANTAAYADGGPWLAGVLDYVDGNRRLLAELVDQLLPGVGYTPPEGTYLAWLDFRATGIADPVPYFLEKAGVALTDGMRCGDAGRGFGRFTLAMPRPILREAVERMGRALET